MDSLNASTLEEIFSYCKRYKIVIAHVCKGWKTIIFSQPIEVPRGKLDHSYSVRYASYIQYLKTIKHQGLKDLIDLNNALYLGAWFENLGFMAMTKYWGANNFDKALCGAAKKGKICSMKLLKTWGASNFEGCLLEIKGNARRIEVYKLLHSWGLDVSDYYDPEL